MKRFTQWIIESTWFKKYSGILGGIALGMWAQATYWHEIRQTLDVWGITREQWGGFLWAIIGAAGIVTSIGLSLEKSRRARKDGKLT